MFVYTTIAYHVFRHVIPGNPDCHRDEHQINKKIKVIKMLMTIVLLFAICWLPIHVFSLLVWFYPKFLKVKTRFGYVLYVISYFSCHFISMAHSTVNPICYCFMSENFRMNLRALLSRCYLKLKVCRSIDEGVYTETQGQTLSSGNNTRIYRINKFNQHYKDNCIEQHIETEI
ncbi:RYamide receptor-like [Oppia nitens]|uniref:RYamide receptor-like n=1 Tax=Oppia nitens TaxID=1686743 RepID=UPI0023DCEA8A|nr:RYamide receptor-like [Oppia nitens]